MSSSIITNNVSDRVVGQVLPWLPEQPAPKFQVVPYDSKMSLARQSIVITFLKSQKKVPGIPLIGYFLGEGQKIKLD